MTEQQGNNNKVKVTPDMIARFAVMVTLFGYLVVTLNPTGRSINVYWSDLFPFTRVFFDVIMPIMCALGIFIVNVFAKKYPYSAILISTAPIFIYMACSVGWVLATYGTDNPTNPVAAFTHISVVSLIYAIAWMGSYYADITS